MIGIVVTGHGHFASGILSAVAMITGEKRQITHVDFMESMSTEDLCSALRKAAEQVDSGEGILFLSDIPGGTPFQQSAIIASHLKLAGVLSGTNLMMTAEACIERENSAFYPLVNTIVSKGKDSVKSLYLASLEHQDSHTIR